MPTDEEISNDETLLNDPDDGRSDTAGRQLIKRQLCTACKRLELSVDRFIISQSLQSQHDVSNFPLKSSTSINKLGCLSDIRRRAYLGCPFCNLVVRSTQDTTSQNDQIPDINSELDDVVCHASWEVDGRDVVDFNRSSTNPNSAHNSARGRTRRIHLRWKHKRLQDSYLVFIAPKKYSTTNSDAQRVWGNEALFLGRSVNKSGDNQALVKSWLDLCRGKHRGPCATHNQDSAKEFLEMISHSYFGVIDVLNMQLTELPYVATSQKSGDFINILPGPAINETSSNSESSSSDYEIPRAHRCHRSVPHRSDDVVRLKPAPYVALSYVWGQKEYFTTLRENVILLRTHGGLERVLSQLPRVIKDAINLVRQLGLQYIWIDALCIVQNSPRSWKLNAYNMDLIYGNATLTICAADGPDGSVGLRAMHSGEHNSVQIKEDCTPSVSLMVTQPPEIYIKASKWNTRAWTFQERLLSRRCLIFTEGRVYFQCRSTGMSEDIYADREGAGWSLDFVDAPMQIFRQLSNRTAWVYMKSVEMYSSRELSKPKDILAAFSGITNLMEQKMRSPFIFGLPSSHFDLALLWEPLKTAKRRKAKQKADGAKSDTKDEEDDYGGMEFPSWSWSGWMDTTTTYREGMVGGCVDNVSRWLEKHTWIKWYVRDSYGDLRPLWDDVQSKVDRSKDRKWRGYKQTHYLQKQFAAYGYMDKGKRRFEIHRLQAEREALYKEQREQHLRRRRERSPGIIRYDEEVMRRGRYHSYGDPVDDGRRDSGRKVVIEEEVDSPQVDIYDKSHPNYVYANGPEGISRRIKRGRASPIIPPMDTRDTYRRYSDEEDIDIRIREKHNSYRPGRERSEREISGRERDDYGAPLPLPTERMPKGYRPVHNSDFFEMFFENTDENNPEGSDFTPKFNITMKDYPYRVVVAPYDPKPDSFEFPLLPILQFWTWHTLLNLRRTSDPHDSSSDNPLGEGLVRCHIADGIGDWCGSIVLDENWLHHTTPAVHEFIAISKAKNFTKEECDSWTYYIPKEREQSEWDLYYVLLIERKDEKWERVGLGKVFMEAFRNSKWKEIMLG